MPTQALEVSQQFWRRSAALRESARDFRGPNLSILAGAALEAVTLFGEAEIRGRRVGARDALEAPGSEESLRQRTAQGNERGLRRLADARKALDGLGRDLREGYRGQALDARQLDEFTAEFRETLGEGDLGAEDAKEVVQQLRSCTDAMRSGGSEGLLRHMQGGLDRLERARREGARGNPIPPWKLAAIILIVGVAIFAFLHCTIWGCSASRNGYIGAFTVLGLIAMFC